MALHGRSTRVIGEGVDLSGYLRDAGVQLQAGTLDATPFNAGVKGYVEDFPDARASIAGFYDTAAAGAFRVLAPRFGKGNQARFVVCPEGFGQGKISVGYSGIITSFNQPRSVSEIQALQMDTQIVGEVYEMVNINHHLAMPISNAGAIDVDRAADSDFTAPYNASFSGLLYFMIKNTLGTAISMNVKHATSTGGLTAASVTIATGSIAAGATFVGVAGTKDAPLTVGIATRVEYASGATATGVPFYLGLVDPNLSLLAG